MVLQKQSLKCIPTFAVNFENSHYIFMHLYIAFFLLSLYILVFPEDK